MSEESAPRTTPAGRAATATMSLPILVVALTALAGALRLHRLGERSLWVDEITTAQTTTLHGLGQVLAATPVNRMPLDLVLSWALHFLGSGEFALRLPSAIYGTLLVPLVFVLGRRLLDTPGGLLAAFLVAISPFPIWYSQEASPYSLLMLLTTLQAWAALRAVERARLGDWLLLALATALNLYTHYTAAFVTLAVFAYVATEIALQARDPRMRWEPAVTRLLGAGTAGMLAILALAPWAPAIRGFLTLQAGADAAKYGGSATAGPAARVGDLLAGLGLEWAVAALAIAGLWWSFRRRSMLLAFWLGLPLLALAILLGPGMVNLLPRYLAAEWPAAALLAAAGVEVCVVEIAPALRLPPSATAATLAALLALTAGVQSARWYGEPKDDWRAAAAAVSSSPGEALVLAMGLGSDFAATSLDYYLRRDGSRAHVLDAGGSTDNRAVDDGMAATIRAHPGPAWAVFAGLRGPADLRADGRSQTGSYTSPAALPPGFTETDLTGVTLVRAPSSSSLLDWGATFIPAVRATAALVEESGLGSPLLPPPGTGSVHIDASGPPADRTWSTAASGKTAVVATFRCASSGGGDARVYVSAHDGRGSWLGLYPGNSGYPCRGGAGAFAFALPAGTVLVKLWLRVTGHGGGDFTDVSLSVVEPG